MDNIITSISTNVLPWIWLTVLIICILVEAFTFAFTTIWGAIAAVPLIFISKTSLDFKWQLLIFAGITLLLVIFTRPFVVKKLKLGREKTNVDSMINEEILVVKKISKFNKGEAKSKNGVVWAAKSADDEEIPEGAVCIISQVEGNTLIVRKKADSE